MFIGCLRPEKPFQKLVVHCWKHAGKSVDYDVACIKHYLRGRALAGVIYDYNAGAQQKNSVSVIQSIRDAFMKEEIKVLGGWFKSKKSNTKGIPLVKAHLDPDHYDKTKEPLLMLNPSPESGGRLLAIEFRKYKGRPATKFSGPNGVIKLHDDLCLVGDTLVSLMRGDVPLRDVRVGDLAWTRKGWRTVEASACTGINRPVITITTEGGASVTGTGSHPMWVVGQGWTPLASLKYGDTVLQCKNAKPSPIAESATTEKNSDTTPAKRASCSIALPGNWKLAQSQRDTSFITRTKAPAITISPILPALLTKSTQESTIGSCPQMRLQPLLSGMQEMPDSVFTAPLPLASGSPERPLNTIAHGAEPPSGAVEYSQPELGSVAAIAEPRIENHVALTTSQGNALDVGQRSAWTSTRKISIVPTRVVSVAESGTANVYNLTVEDAHEFLANGVLSSNCDPLKYWCAEMAANQWQQTFCCGNADLSIVPLSVRPEGINEGPKSFPSKHDELMERARQAKGVKRHQWMLRYQ
jgi:hypothetical protein